MNSRILNALSPPVRRLLLAVAFAFGSVFALACDIHTSSAPAALASITVTPNVTLAINATQQFIAVGRDANGVAIAISPVWSIVAGGGAINNVGFFTAGTLPGTYTTTVQAASGGMSGAATVTVVIGPLATITVTPTTVTLGINGTQQYTAVGKDAGGNIITISPTWSVVASGGTINQASGLFTAGAVAGTFPSTVRATSGGISGTATVTVGAGALATVTVSPDPATVPMGGTLQYSAVGRDANGNVVAITPTWSVVASGGTIASTTGLFTAGATAGSFPSAVRAISGTISGTASVTVTSGALATITVSPTPVTLSVNGTQQYTAVGRDALGTVVTITPTWSVVAGGGSITGGALFTAG